MKDIAYRSNPEKDYLQPCVFATTDTHMDWTKVYCLAENPKAVFEVDMAYKCGWFYVTPVKKKHPMFVKKMILYPILPSQLLWQQVLQKNAKITSFLQRKLANLWLENP